MHTLDTIIDTLDRNRQRATYGAVAGLLRTTPRKVMTGRPRDPRHSWVVSRSTGQPTKYPPEQVHPELETNPKVIITHEELAGWLSAVQ